MSSTERKELKWKYPRELHTAPNGERLTPSERAMVTVLCGYLNPDELLAWPSHATLARDLGKTKRAVIYTLNSLARKGVIKRYPPIQTGKRSMSYAFPYLRSPNEISPSLCNVDVTRMSRTQTGEATFTTPVKPASSPLKPVSPSLVKPASPELEVELQIEEREQQPEVLVQDHKPLSEEEDERRYQERLIFLAEQRKALEERFKPPSFYRPPDAFRSTRRVQ
ncbi:MAG TPA: helix-turn-helix domain-containing protein [Candidatus Nanoarchaeia archaeon]|nr:helix-turn-helix domain-containing protein [Candidatus Nanoarchaeia archaeon]